MAFIDSLTWSMGSGNPLEADRSGWQPRNKAWKAERQALWQRINTGPFVSYNDGMGYLTKAKDIKILEEFFLTGKSGYSVGKDNNPVTLVEYLLFYPALSVEVLDRIVPSLLPEALNSHKLTWLLPRWQLYYLNFPEYFSERIRLLQNYFWPFNPQTNAVNSDSLQSLTGNIVSTVSSYANYYLVYNGIGSQPVVALPEGWDNTRGLHYFFEYLSSLPEKNSITIPYEKDWHELFLHLRHYTPWNALPGAGLEQQQAFVSTFVSLIEQYCLPEKLQTIWMNAAADSVIATLAIKDALDGANNKALIAWGPFANLCHQLSAIVGIYHSQRFTDALFDKDKVAVTDLATLLSAPMIEVLGFPAGEPVPAYSYDIDLTPQYYQLEANKRQVSLFLAMPYHKSRNAEAMLILVERPYKIDRLEYTIASKHNWLYMAKWLATRVDLPMARMHDFTYFYFLQKLCRNPDKYPLTEAELQEMQQSGWYRREQFNELFIDKPYLIFKQLPEADEALPSYDGELPALDGK